MLNDMDYKFIQYFRNALAVQNQNTIDFKNIDNLLKCISMESFEKGFLPINILNELCPKEKNEQNDVYIIFAVKTILTEYSNGVEIEKNIDKLTGVFYVPAKITFVDGKRKMMPALEENKLPWIPRKFLSPSEEPILILGEASKSDEFFSKTTAIRTSICNWDEYIKYCKNYFFEVTGTALSWKEDYKRKIKYENNVFVFADPRIDAVKSLINLYDNIIQNLVSGKLLHKYLEYQEAGSKKLLDDEDVSFMMEHQGQMNGMYPLAKSQRRVLNHTNNMNTGDIIAVSGPPGTGKTTLLQSVVADMYVKAALLDERPPVIVASSSNNQAVTNIIESFQKIQTNDNTNLEKRWIVAAEGFAVYFPSKNKEKEAIDKGYQITRAYEWNHFVNKISDTGNIEESKSRMLQEAGKYFQIEFTDLKECKRTIKKCLKIIDDSRIQLLRLYPNRDSIFNKNTIGTIIWTLKELGCNIFGINEDDKRLYIKQSRKAFSQISLWQFNELLDKTIRYVEFWLAVHYCECRFLEGEYATTQEQKSKQNADIYKDIFYQIALLSPCMVMTFHSMPNNFRVSGINESKYTYLYNFIDLLIIDEAGQVSPEIATAAFSLAKKALVVGDEKQIPPVWNIEKSVDIGLAQEVGLITDAEQYKKMERMGLNCCSSSVMKVAKKSCYYNEEKIRGLFLSEHRRCYDEIIAYCNELVYEGMLRPSRGRREKKPNPYWPIMGHYDIFSDKADKKGTSRINETEAKTIACWLSENYVSIENYYCEDDPRQIIAIITPFKEQVSIIKKQLQEYMKDKANAIDVGTVHTFQGADRKIIILSTVYGKSDGCPFVDNNPALMNVAVSRAKDAFWVFGAYDCLSEDSKLASGKLREYASDCLPWKLNV